MSDLDGKTDGMLVIPVIAEQLHVAKRTVVTGGVRIRKRVLERTEVIDASLVSDQVSVEHVPAGRFVDTVPQVRVEGDVTIVPVVEERVVMEKRLWLREEVHLRRHRTATSAPQTMALLQEEVTVDRLSAADAQAWRADEPPVGTQDAITGAERKMPAGQPATPVE